MEEQSSDGGQTGDSTSTSADARPACPKKQTGSRRKRWNRKKQKRKTGAGGSQGSGCSGESVAAPVQSQTQSGSRSVPSDRGSQPRFSGEEAGPAPHGPAPRQSVRRDQSTRRDQGSHPRSAGKRTGPAPSGPAPRWGPTNGERNQRRKSGGNTVPPNDNRRERRDRGPARGNAPRGNTVNPGHEPRAGAGPNPSGRRVHTDSTTHRESQQLRDSRVDAGDTAPSWERPADRLPSLSSSTEPSWLSDEVTDEEWKALADFVRCEWEKFEDMVQALIDHIADVCKHHMDAAVTQREASSTQCWWWQKKCQNRAWQKTRQNSPPNNPTQNDGPYSGGHSHEGRTRRLQAARKRYNGPQAQCLQRLFLRNRKACVRRSLRKVMGDSARYHSISSQTFSRMSTLT